MQCSPQSSFDGDLLSCYNLYEPLNVLTSTSSTSSMLISLFCFRASDTAQETTVLICSTLDTVVFTTSGMYVYADEPDDH